MTPEMSFDLERHHTSCFAHFAADRHRIPRGFSAMLPRSLLGVHRTPLHAVVLACRTVSGQVCQGLMSLTTRAVTKRLGAAFLLVRALLGSYWPYG